MGRCLAKRTEPALSPINTDILTSAPRHCLALCLAKLGDAPGAQKAFTAALEEKGRTESVKLDYARFLSEQNRPVDALHCLHEIIAQSPDNLAAWKLGGEVALSRPDFLEFAQDWTGESIQHFPAEPSIAAQRAEVLMLRQETAEARPLWETACNGARPARALAALILCAAAGTESVPATRDAAEETAASRAFVEWYQRLLSVNASETLLRLNSRVDALREALPTAARLLETALAEAQEQTA
jgi:tetratricopeptide (TPR) repeat protein